MYMLSKLPEDIIQVILSFSSTRVILALGREPNATHMLFEGGPSNVLNSILQNDGDLKSIMSLKYLVPANTAIVKAVFSGNQELVKRVCILWETWCSDHGFAAACHQQFAWAIQHIQPSHTPSIAQYNRIYFELREYNKIDLSIQSPFEEFTRIPQSMIAERINEYAPYKSTLSEHELLLFYLLDNQQDQVVQLLQNNDHDHDLKDALYSAIKYGKRYEISQFVYNQFGHEYGVTQQDMWTALVESQDIDAMTYFKIPHLQLHRAVLTENISSINAYLIQDRKAALNVLAMYEESYRYYLDSLDNPQLSLDHEGYWQGAPNSIKRFMFGHPFYSGEWMIRDIMKNKKIRTLDDLGTFLDTMGGVKGPPPRTILGLLEDYGDQVLDESERILYLLPHFTKLDKESTWKLLTVLVNRGFEIKTDTENTKPCVFLCNQTIYHTISDYFESSYLQSSMVFSEAVFLNDVILALKTFADSLPHRESRRSPCKTLQKKLRTINNKASLSI